jgi:cobalt-zinc-cadmium efflux system protein
MESSGFSHSHQDGATHSNHGPEPRNGGGGGKDYSSSLRAGLAVTLIFFAVEVAGGYLSGSLSLISDAGHMFIDAFSLLLALGAIQAARSLPTKERTYGLHRAGIFAAFINALFLVGVSGVILFEAYGRFTKPQPVDGELMLVVAIIGLAANIYVAYRLHGSGDVNVRGAFLHVTGDALSSLAVIGAAVWITVTGQTIADPLLSGAIAIVILVSATGMLRETIAIFLQFTPRGLDYDKVIREMESTPGVAGVHDVHIWSLSSHIFILDAHVYCCEPDVVRIEDIKKEIKHRLEQFGILHSTLEFECRECRQGGSAACTILSECEPPAPSR